MSALYSGVADWLAPPEHRTPDRLPSGRDFFFRSSRPILSPWVFRLVGSFGVCILIQSSSPTPVPLRTSTVRSKSCCEALFTWLGALFVITGTNYCETVDGIKCQNFPCEMRG